MDKRCTKCQQLKAHDDFYFTKKKDRAPGSRHATCKECSKAAIRRYRLENPHKVREWNRKNGAIGHPPDPISEDEWLTMLVQQDSRCAICRKDFINISKIATDHCHGTGRIRGLLCFPCNGGLGYFRDNPSALRNAAEYLEVS